ncbi:uncharacterized protein [Ptychodera flava]|uniref:uncharacterized protein n=1 Tax=Ptychodera flava TaxID=63121 RepID=UPI00396AA74E
MQENVNKFVSLAIPVVFLAIQGVCGYDGGGSLGMGGNHSSVRILVADVFSGRGVEESVTVTVLTVCSLLSEFHLDIDNRRFSYPGVCNSLYGHAAIGTRCVEIQRYAKQPNVTLNLLVSAHAAFVHANVVDGASDTDSFLAANSVMDDGTPSLMVGDLVIVDNCPTHHNHGGAVSDGVADAERIIEREKIEVDTSAVVPKARSEEEIVQSDDIESSQVPDISEAHVYDPSIGDTSTDVKESTSQGKHLSSDQTQGTALLAMEVEPNAQLSDVYKKVVSKCVGEFTQIPPETSDQSAGNALVLLKQTQKNRPLQQLEILHLLGIRKIFRNISLESCVYTDEVGREFFSPSNLHELLSIDVAELFTKHLKTVREESLLARALAPLKSVNVDKTYQHLCNRLFHEYKDCQIAKTELELAKNQLEEWKHQLSIAEKEKLNFKGRLSYGRLNLKRKTAPSLD